MSGFGQWLSPFIMCASQVGRWEIQRLYDDETAWGSSNCFGKPWEEVVHEGSMYFSDGQLEVEVGMRLPGKRREHIV